MSECEKLVADPKCGSTFQVYFDCGLRQEKCTAAGVTDAAATRAAIMAGCAAEIDAYRSCTGTSPPPPMCGLVGLGCCTNGSPTCASTACCDPATNICRGQGEACSAASSVCSANQCGACGAPGQPCCQIFGMTEPNPCPSGGCCNYSAGQAGGTCIAEGGVCTPAGPTTTETVCKSKSCITCGGTFGTCCSGNSCTSANTVCNAANTTCVPCGSSGEPCCEGNTCPVARTQCTGGVCP